MLTLFLSLPIPVRQLYYPVDVYLEPQVRSNI